METLLPTLVQEKKKEFEIVIQDVKSNNKMLLNKLKELLNDVKKNDTIINDEGSKILSFFEQLPNIFESNNSLQKALEDRDEYKFKTESLEKQLLHVQNEICQLKVTERKPTYNVSYSEKELEFLHKENSRLIKREKDLHKEIEKYKEMELQFYDQTCQIDHLKKCNVENQTKMIEKDIEYHKKSSEYESIISKLKEENKCLSEELNCMKTELLLMKESHSSTQCSKQISHLVVEDAVHSSYVVQEDKIDAFQEMEGVLIHEKEAEIRLLPPAENISHDVSGSEYFVPTSVAEKDETEKRQRRRRKEVNYCELDDGKSSKGDTIKKTESSKNVGSCNILSESKNMMQKKKIRIKNVEQNDISLNDTVNKKLDDKAASADDDMNIQNMDPNIEELAIRRVASEEKLFKKPRAQKKRNVKQVK